MVKFYVKNSQLSNKDKIKLVDEAVKEAIIVDMEKVIIDMSKDDTLTKEQIAEATALRHAYNGYDQAAKSKGPTHKESLLKRVPDGAWRFGAAVVGGGLTLLTTVYATMYTDNGNMLNDTIRNMMNKKNDY